MREFMTFFTPTLGSGLVQAVLTIINLILVLGGIFFLAFFILISIFQIKKLTEAPKKSLTTAMVWAVVWMALLCVLSIYGPRNLSSTEGGWTGGIRFLMTVLDPIFSISTMADSPFPYFTGLNLLVRVILLCAIMVLVRKAYEVSRKSAKNFGRFLENKVYAKDSEPEEEPEQEPAGSQDAPVPAPNSAASGTAQGGAQKKGSVSISDLLIKLLTASGVLGSLFGYIFGTDDTRSAIEEILESVETLLNMATLTSKINPAAEGVAAFLSNFLYIILSICILAIYGTILLSLLIFLAAAYKHRNDIIKWIVSNAKKIWLCVGVVVLIVLACTVVFVAGSGFDALRAIFATIFAAGPKDVFGVAAKFILLVLAICVAMLMLGFVILFAIFVTYLGYQTVCEGTTALKASGKVLHYAKVTALIVVGAGVLLGVAFGYENIRDGLVVLFLSNEDSGVTLLWVLGHIFLLFAAVLGILMAALIALTLVKVMLSGLGQFETDTRQTTDKLFYKLIQDMVESLIRLVHLFPFVLKHLYQAGRNFAATMLRIFVGYNTESEKNKAIFVAACFASLASLLNTFFGLCDFYQDDRSLIPVICSFAIACAVQLAMLIFGMKGGESLAENIMSDSIQLGQGYTKAIVSKIFCCIFYLLVYLTVLASLAGGIILGDGPGWNFGTVLPILFILLSTLAFAYGLVNQIIDIQALRKRQRAARNSGAAEPPLPLRRPRRIAPKFYLAAYFMLMIVSTGFAFNNLFGYYAVRAHVHQQVYDQVRDQADVQLDLNQQVTALITQYNKNTSSILDQFMEAEAAAIAFREEKLENLRESVKGDPTSVLLANDRDRFISMTSDLPTVASAIKALLMQDYENIGDDITLTVEEYSHYWRGNPQESYRTSCVIITFPDNAKTIIGNRATDKKVTMLPASGGYEEVELPDDRYEDPYNKENYSIIKNIRTSQNVNKYIILKELLSWYDKLVDDVNAYKKESYTSADAAPLVSSILNNYLDENSILDGVRGNIAQLCRSLDGRADETVSIQDLSRVVSVYLNQDTSVDTQSEKRGAQTLSEKELEYQKLSGYIDRALTINDMLAASAPVLAQEDDPNEPSTPTLEGDQDTAAYKVRKYRNYAQGIAYSNFLISYDALLHGGLGLNQDQDVLNDLYHSTTVAVFMFLICMLVDLMAFFAGLLLFKDIFLFERNKKLDELGYLNYEAALTNFFTLPEGQKEHEQLLRLALIYVLLYGFAARQNPNLSKASLNMQKLHNILESNDFQTFYTNAWMVLHRLGIDYSNLADLRLWLTSFVAKNEIKFDDLFTP